MVCSGVARILLQGGHGRTGFEVRGDSHPEVKAIWRQICKICVHSQTPGGHVPHAWRCHGWYGTVLANTAVLCMHVHIVCRYVAPPCEYYYNTLLCCDYFYRLVWYRALSLRYVCIQSSGIILIP